jgi:hypothetical protein
VFKKFISGSMAVEVGKLPQPLSKKGLQKVMSSSIAEAAIKLWKLMSKKATGETISSAKEYFVDAAGAMFDKKE